MAGRCLFGILFLIALVYGQSEYNCHQKPPFTADVKNCCKRPSLNLGKYRDQCYNATVTSRFGRKPDDSHAFMNPCAVECIFTKGGALQNGQFNMANTNALLKEVMPNDLALANVLIAGFRKCGPEVYTKMQEFEAKQKGQNFQMPGTRQQCSPYAVLVTFCAMRHTFINCPTNLWTSSETCTKAQEYVRNCEPMQFGGPKKSVGK